MKGSERPEAVRIFSYLYSVVIGLALIAGVQTLISPQGGRHFFELPLGQLLTFGSFIFTIVPFYHGAIRFLSQAYNQLDTERGGKILMDFAIFLVEASIFYALAINLSEIPVFVSWLGLLLVVDVVWVGLANLIFSKREGSPTNWAAINSFMIAFLIVFWSIGIQNSLEGITILFVASIIRTVADYKLAFHYYFDRPVK